MSDDRKIPIEVINFLLFLIHTGYKHMCICVEWRINIEYEWIDVYLNKLENMSRNKSKKKWKQYNKNQQKEKERKEKPE
jgi:hypothetical protein